MSPRQSLPVPPGLVGREIDRLLAAAPAYRQLDAGTREALRVDLASITRALAAPPNGHGRRPLAGQLAPPALRERLGPRPEGDAPAGGDGQVPAPSGGAVPTGQSATGRVGEVARATLSAIDFPQFVASLIQGTFQAIVDASIQQMEAYAELLRNVARTVDQFMAENISEGTAKDYLADKYDRLLTRDTSDGRPTLRINPDGAEGGELPTFFKDLGFESAGDIDDAAMEQVVVPAARRDLAEQRQQTLATMVLMGINRVVVDDGEITAKLQFHIDAAETLGLRFDQTKTTGGNMAGRAGRNPFTANAIMVNTTSLNAQSDINVRADLTGQVRVKFRSETFPLERFADSAAIQLINQNAKVPPPAAPAQNGGAPLPAGAPVAAGPAVAAPAAPPATPPAAPAPAAPAAQSLYADPWADPWAPRARA